MEQGRYEMIGSSRRNVVRGGCICVVVSLFAALALFLFYTSFRVVAPANACVLKIFGHVHSDVLGQGVNVVLPFSTLSCFSLRKQLLETNNSVPTNEGLSVDLDVAIVFALKVSHVRTMYLDVGPDYVNTIISPELSSAIRGLTAAHDANALYTSARHVLQDELRAALTEKFDPFGLILHDVLLKSVTLPPLLLAAIEKKAKADQEAQQMEFVLVKERAEADRKRIEAQGIADFQNIVSQGISAQLLQWKGIEATEKFATSPNTKLVLVGNTGDSLPVLLSAGNGGQQEDN